MRFRISFAAVILASAASGQTYYYVNSISVDPPAPTDADNITITLHGDLSSTGAYVVSTSFQVIGSVVELIVNAADPGGFQVLVPHNETFNIGTLPAGIYHIGLGGTFVADLAPQPQHDFVVSGVGGDFCDSLIVASVQWAAFTDSMIEVHVYNNSSQLFDYPGFILYDQNGDTLAKEMVNFFGIAPESWHLATIHDGAIILSGTFPATLELWTGFYNVMACSWNLTVDLCPPGPCSTLFPTIQNLGGALAIGTYSWSIFDGAFNLMGSGVLEMSDTVQYDMDTLCLPPGDYTMAVSPNDPPTGGNPVFSVTTEGWISGPSAQVSWSLPVPMPFTFFGPCIQGGNAIAEPGPAPELQLTLIDHVLHVTSLSGSLLGQIRVMDAAGREVRALPSSGTHQIIPLEGLSHGVYVIHAGMGRTAARSFVLTD